jgi:hypothetical protein|tara:strand:+ start:549 stop:818 length:270 start_codon:yes stop_codon:yes gene_type:complete
MPLKKCSEDKQSGWKWGDTGKCYTGKNAKQKAIKQGIAIEGPEKFQQKASQFEENLTEEDVEFLSEYMIRKCYDIKTIVAVTAALRWNT